jgi:IS1 family transposase
VKKFGRFQNRNRSVQRYRCVRCGKTFSEDQPLDHLRLSHDKVIQIVKLLTEGMGIRAVSRLTGCHKRTVLEVLRVVGEKCEQLHDKLVRNIETGSLQIDELWSRVGIRQQRITQDDTERGDQYTYLAVTAREKLIVSYHTGKRDYVNTEAFIADVEQRIAGRIQITTDGWQAYPEIIRRYLLPRLNYAVMQKIYGPQDPNDTNPNRRYSLPRCTGVRVDIIAGVPRRDRIGTSYVERTNLTVRHFNKRFARLGLGWSRKLDNHKAAISLFVAVFNFCKVHNTLGTTPAHGAGITDGPWTVERLIEEATTC